MEVDSIEQHEWGRYSKNSQWEGLAAKTDTINKHHACTRL